ncbi:MAG: nitrous oxide-stimulated promoter family protein [Candidatus Zixiibacteriota bacterium]
MGETGMIGHRIKEVGLGNLIRTTAMDEESKSTNKAKDIQKDVSVLARFIDIFCANNHSGDGKSRLQAKGDVADYLKNPSLALCPDCSKLLSHGVSKRISCPYDPKPRCKRCPTPCYAEGYREKIREVMRFSGAYLLKRGRLDLAMKYFF